MISGTMLTEALEEVKKITSLDVVVTDDKGDVKAETLSPPERAERILATFALSDKMCHEEKDIYLLRDRYEGADIDFIVMLWGEAQGRSLTTDLVALQVKQFLKGNESRTPVNDLLSNLLLDNILHTNIESEASYLGIDPSEVRRVFIARASEGRESAVLAKARNAFAANEDIHVVSVERGKTAVIVDGLAPDKAGKKAEAIFDTLGGEENGVLMVSYGLPVNDLEKLIILFGVFYSIAANSQHMIKSAGNKVSVTVFFDEGTSDARIAAIGEEIKLREEVDHIDYTSAEQAWEDFKSQYFGEYEYLAEGFKDDNPLANSASYSVYLADTAKQDQLVSYLEGIENVRQVNKSTEVARNISTAARLAGYVSIAVIIILLAVSIFLITNTIAGYFFYCFIGLFRS